MRSKFIPLSVPNLKGNELKYVTNAVEAEWVSTAGSYVTDFEKNIASYVGTTGAVACQSGTAGLHVACLVCGVRRGDIVIVPTLTFIAAVNPLKYIGAEPVFMDCDDSLCLDPAKLEEFCNEQCEMRDGELYYKKFNGRVPALIVVHVFGNMADMQKIIEIAKKFNLKVIEDATEALGTKYTEGKYSGKFAGTMGDVGVYSFNGNKIITTGGGGMIVAQDNVILEHAKHLTTQAKADVVRFVHDEVGYNYRLTNLQAALGLAQLEQLESFIQTKNENYQKYRELLKDIPGLSILSFRSGVRANCWFYSLYCSEEFPWNRDEIIYNFQEQNIQCRPIWGLIHEQKPYAGSLMYKIEKALDYHRHVVNLPCSTNLTQEDLEFVVMILKDACQ